MVHYMLHCFCELLIIRLMLYLAGLGVTYHFPNHYFSLVVYFEELFDTKQDDYGNNKDDTRSLAQYMSKPQSNKSKLI